MRFEQKTDNFFFTYHCGCGRRLGKGIYIFLLLPLISEKSAGIEPPLCEIFPSSVDTSVRQNDFWPKEFEYFLFTLPFGGGGAVLTKILKSFSPHHTNEEK